MTRQERKSMRFGRALALLAGAFASCAAAAVELTGGWTLAADPENAGKREGWAAAVRADAKPAPVPGVIQQVFPRHAGVAWYYRRLTRPAVAAGERLRLEFGAAAYYSETYLDGKLLGTHEGAEDPFGFDVTDALKDSSLLAVRVIVPGETEIEGFSCKTVPHRNMYEKMEFKPGWCYLTGGLTLPVRLDVVPAVRVTDAFVKADVKTGRVTVETTVANDTGASVAQAFSFVVRSDDAPYPAAVHAVTQTVPAGGATFETAFDVPGFRPWSFDVPQVYSLEVGGYRTTFGFRDFRLVKGWFTLNGKRVFLKSAHTGNHLPGGLAVVDPATPELEFRDFQNMKAMGYNCIRFIATQATPRQLDYCDRLGLMVYQETYASWSLADSPEGKRRFLDSMRAELRRDRNHPSLVIWGAINEMRQGDAIAAARDMLPEMRKLDPTRLWLYSSGRWDLWPKPPSKDRGGHGFQYFGLPGPDWSIGSASNPGSVTWDHVWGEDGVVANNDAPSPGKDGLKPACGDLHYYPGFPHNAAQTKKLREWSAQAKPAFISEYGVGSLLDVIDHCAEFARRGIPATSPDYARMAEIRDRFLADWAKLGLDRHFADPVDFLRDSERYNARSRREGFDLVRSNPRFVGYNLTGALDHAICGEGPMSLFRRLKDQNFDVFRDGWSDLRWCLFLEKYNLFPGEDVRFEAVLADFDALREGDYKATFALVDAERGELVVRSEPFAFAVPQREADGLRKTAFTVAKTALKAPAKPGRYFLRAYLDHGGYAAAFEKAFYVTARPSASVGGQLLTVGAVSEREGAEAMRKVAAGATALVRVDLCRGTAPKFLPLKNFAVRNRSHWLYHDDTIVVPGALTQGLKTGFLDWDYYAGTFPLLGFTSDTPADEVAFVDFNVAGPEVYSCRYSLATYRHGKGRLIVTTLPLDEKTPAGAQILVNAARLAAPASRADRLGVGMECLDRDLWDPFPAMPHLKDLGIRRVRLQSGWARTEKTKGAYDFAWMDKIVDALTEIGVTPWISLSYGNPIYACAADGEQDYTGQKMFPMRTPEAAAAWQNYVRAIVARYRDRVDTWEIWNEPDCAHFLKVPDGSNWATEYLRLARLTAATVREVMPTARVVVCTASGPDGRERYSAELFEGGAGDIADVYTFHGYRALPEAFTPVERRAFYGAVRKYAPNIEFWRGEAGLSSKKSGRGALHHLPLSEEMQARWMSRHLVRDLADPEISFTSYFHLFDFDHYSHEVTYHYGVLRDKDYSRKPSFDVLKRIKALLDDGNAAPDASVALSVRPARKAPTATEEAIAAGAVVYAFRRNAHPLFAVTASWPATEAMAEVPVKASCFFGDSEGQWQDPVLFDLVTGEVTRLTVARDWPSPVVRFNLANHVRIVTEAAALSPLVKLAPRTKTVRGAAGPSKQKDHE